MRQDGFERVRYFSDISERLIFQLKLLTFITLWANSADVRLLIFFSYFFPENRIWNFMQIHTICMKCQILFGKMRKVFQYIVCWKFYQEG